jgi:hypothetical protein
MVLLKGFPPSNTISPGIRLPMCHKCNKVFDWCNVATCGDNKYICQGCHSQRQEADPHHVVLGQNTAS